MTAVLLVALALPLGAAAAAVLVSDRPSVPSAAAGATALCWAALAVLDQPVELGRIVADPLPAVALAGTAALFAGRTPRTTAARSAGLCALTLLAVGACWGTAGVPDRPLGLAVVVLSVAIALEPEHSGWAARVLSPPVAGVVVGVAVVVGEGAEAVVVAATLALLLAAVVWQTGTGFLVLPAALLAVHGAAEAVHSGADASEWPTVSVAGAAGASVVAVAMAWSSRRQRSGPSAWSRSDRLHLAVVAAGVVLVAQDLGSWRSAGLLLAAGGVLALAAAHPVALVAALPGVAAALEVSALGAEPVHAVAAGAATGVLAAGALRGSSLGTVPGLPSGTRPTALLLAAAVFGIAPLWGWSGVHPDRFVPAVATAAAGAGAVAVGVVVAGLLGTELLGTGLLGTGVRRQDRSVPTGSRRPPGRLQRRSNAVNHASTYPPAEEVGPVEEGVEEAGAVEEDGSHQVGAEVRVPPGEGGAGRPPQPPVASPPRIVPRRAGGGGVGGRGRLRARPGRPA
jgi:hypothetical protein